MQILPSAFQSELAHHFVDACQRANILLPENTAIIEKPRIETHGDFCCPLALACAKQKKIPPRQLAEQIIAALDKPEWVSDIQIAGAGFINLFIQPAASTTIISEILASGEQFGRRDKRNATVLIEFISANPTGPLHVGHGRACAYGDSLANLLSCRGYDVRREYYVNDAGRQMHILVASVWLRHWWGADAQMPVGSYRGDYLIPVANGLVDLLATTASPPDELDNDLQAAQNPDAAADLLVTTARLAIGTETAFAAIQQKTRDFILDTIIKEDMRALGVNVDNINFFYETTLHASGKISATLQQLTESGNLTEEDGALWFNATAYGDDKKRVVRRSNGELTYFAADIAYHADKLSRDYPNNDEYRLLNVLGADHHGYAPRLRAAILALGHAAEKMETHIIQLVSLIKDGARLKMSTRAGTFITLRDVVNDIGGAIARYFYISRKNDQHLDFNLSIAKARKNENPAFYIQYANARINSVFQRWGGDTTNLALTLSPELLAEDTAALKLCKKLADYPALLEHAALERAPHLLATYLHELASVLHGYYETTRILSNDNDANITKARLAALVAAQIVFNNGMALLGITLPDSM